jgi:RNA-directed DNA polymerase
LVFGQFRFAAELDASRFGALASFTGARPDQIPLTIPDQAGDLNAVLRGHYAYYGIAGNIRALQKVYRAVERYWRKMLCSRSWAGRHLTWEVFGQIKERTPLLRPKLYLPYRELQALAVL